jgi:hypothetical protein
MDQFRLSERPSFYSLYDASESDSTGNALIVLACGVAICGISHLYEGTKRESRYVSQRKLHQI